MRAILVAALVAAPLAAHAQTQVTIYAQSADLSQFTAASVGTGSTQVLPASGSRKSLYLVNTNTSPTVYCEVGSTPVVGSASIVLAPASPRGNVWVWESGAPTGAVNCIAASSVTIKYSSQ